MLREIAECVMFVALSNICCWAGIKLGIKCVRRWQCEDEEDNSIEISAKESRRREDYLVRKNTHTSN